MDMENSKMLKMHKFISLLIIVTGMVLMTFMIIVEDEPGAIPLLLIVIGTGWHLFTRSRIKSQRA
jgi:hypothetical protein